MLQSVLDGRLAFAIAVHISLENADLVRPSQVVPFLIHVAIELQCKTVRNVTSEPTSLSFLHSIMSCH